MSTSSYPAPASAPIEVSRSVDEYATLPRTRWAAPRAVGFFVLANLVLQLTSLASAAPKMIRVIRADGGSAAEYVVYVVYTAALLLGVAWAVLALFAVLRRMGSERLARAGIVIVQAIVLLCIAAEIITFTVLGLHPYGAVVWDAVGTADIRHLPWWFFAGLAGVSGVFVAVEWLLLRGASRLSRSVRNAGVVDRGIGSRCLAYAMVGLLAFLAIDREDAERLIPRSALPLYSVWFAPARDYPELRPRRMIGDSLHAPTMARRPDIAMVVAESLRWDMLTPETMPVVSRFAVEHGCLVAPRHYAGGHLTQYGAFSLLYGLGGWAFLPYMQEARWSWPLDVLHANEYELYGLDATGVLSYDIDPLVPEQFDRYVTKLGEDSLLIDQTADLLANPEGRSPRFSFTFLYSTHAPYLYPPEFERDSVAANFADPHTRAWTRYLNSATYLDHVVGQLTEALGPRIDDGSAVLVITGDHGEEFWEFGLMGHAAVGFHDVRTRVPLVLCLPGVSGPSAPLSEHADVFPTILSWASEGASPPPGAVSGRSLLRPADPVPVVIAGSGFPGRAGEFALVTRQAKFWLSLHDPEFRNIDLTQVTDLDDRRVMATNETRGLLGEALRQFHLMRNAALQ